MVALESGWVALLVQTDVDSAWQATEKVRPSGGSDGSSDHREHLACLPY